MSDQQCASCGSGLRTGMPTCGRCGAAVVAAAAAPGSDSPAMASTPSFDVEATTNRNVLTPTPRPASEQTLVAQSAWPPPVGLPLGGPPPPTMNSGPPPPAAAFGSRSSATSLRSTLPFLPPEVGLVSLLLIVLAGFLVYPLLRYGVPALGSLASSADYVRAFAALALVITALFGAVGVAFVLLAVGLMRANRVCQILTCLICGIVVLAEAINSPSELTAQTSTTAQRVIGIIGSLVVIGLLVLPNAQRWFARDVRATPGIDVAAAIGLYFGVCAMISGLLLLILGTVELSFVGYGLGLAAAGLGLALATKPLRRGSSAARAWVCVAYVAYVILGFVVGAKEHETSSPQTVVPLLIAIAALVALLVPASSQAHFRRASWPAPGSIGAYPPPPPTTSTASDLWR